MQSDPYLSVVIPVYNEVDSLALLHRELDAALAGMGGEVEIIFVDDGSTDGGGERMRAIAVGDERVRVLTLDGNHGQSTALDAGFRAARGEVTATLDADLQNDPADLPRLLALLDRADVVNGIRANRRDTRFRKLGARVANGFRNWVTGDSVTDVGCSLRVIRTSFLRRVTLHRGMHRFLPTLLRMAGARVIEVPVSHRPRRFGFSKYGNLDRLMAGVVDVFAVRWMQHRNEAYRVDEWRHPRSSGCGALDSERRSAEAEATAREAHFPRAGEVRRHSGQSPVEWRDHDSTHP
jgi:glycosyltransferase involved in cell wall biosynthesis